MTKPKAIAATSAWHTADPRWVDERKQQWRAHALHIKPANHGAKETAILRDYFLLGTTPEEVDWAGEPLPWLPLFYRLWFHPDTSPRNWTAQVGFTTWQDYCESARCFRAISLPADSGLSGLEERVAAAIFGPPATRKILKRPPIYQRQSAWVERSLADLYAFPDHYLFELAQALKREDINVRCASRYELRYFDEHGHPVAWKRVLDDPDAKVQLFQLFELITSTLARGKSRSRTKALRDRLELAQELATLFGGNFGPPALQELWAQHAGRGR